MNGINSLRRRPIFVGEHELTIDDKNRLLIPAQFRKKIDPERDGTLLFVTLKKIPDIGFIPWFYAEDFFRRLVNKHAPPELTPDAKQLKYTHRTLSMADEIEWDSQGRVVLPEKILKPAGLGKEVKEVTLIGAKDHMELWHRSKWQIYREKLIEQSDEIEGWAQSELGTAEAEKTASNGNGKKEKPEVTE